MSAACYRRPTSLGGQRFSVAGNATTRLGVGHPNRQVQIKVLSFLTSLAELREDGQQSLGVRARGSFQRLTPYGPSRNQQLADHRRKHGSQGRHGKLVLPPRSSHCRWQARPDAQRLRTDGRQCCVTATNTVTQDSSTDPVIIGPCGACDHHC